MPCRFALFLASRAMLSVMCCATVAGAHQAGDDPFESLDDLFNPASPVSEQVSDPDQEHVAPTEIEFDLVEPSGPPDGAPAEEETSPGARSAAEDLEAALEGARAPLGPARQPADTEGVLQEPPPTSPASPPRVDSDPSAEMMPAIAPPRRRGSYDQQPLTLRGIVEDDDYRKRCCEEAFCQHIWNCAGGRSPRWHHRLMRDRYRDRMLRNYGGAIPVQNFQCPLDAGGNAPGAAPGPGCGPAFGPGLPSDAYPVFGEQPMRNGEFAYPQGMWQGLPQP